MNFGSAALGVSTVALLGGILGYILYQRVGSWYRYAEIEGSFWFAERFPGVTRSFARRHLRNAILRDLPEQAVLLARNAGLEPDCVALAEKYRPVGEAARYAKKLGLEKEAVRLFTAAFDRARIKGDEGEAVSWLVEGGLHHRAATYYERIGGPVGMRHAGEHYAQSGEAIDAARCFEAAGEPYRAFQALSRAGLPVEVEALRLRTHDGVTRSEAAAWLRKTASK